MSKERADLKYPVGIVVLAILFLFAPIGNIFISVAISGVEGWSQPAVFASLLSSVPWIDWFWLAGVFVAGLALLFRHKSAWMLAVISLLVVLFLNTYRAFTVDESVLNPEMVRVQILISILVTFSVLIIAFYARYPYLDRRQQWMFPTAHRYDFATPIVVGVAGGVTGVSESVSSDGIRIRMPRVVDELKHAGRLELTFVEMNGFKVQSEIVDFNGTHLRLKFKNFGWSGRGRLEAWLKSRKA